jgi:hypothetical protein
MKVPDLKKELKARGLSVTGNKTELLERLQVQFNLNLFYLSNIWVVTGANPTTSAFVNTYSTGDASYL